MTLFEEALSYAIQHHSGQKRKMSDGPYVIHPMEVASIVATMTADEELLAAAVLHDTVEDADATLEGLKERFGTEVYLLVMTETEEKREHLPPAATWKLRKEETLNILENTKDIRVKMLWLGDKLANMRSFYRLHRQMGDSLWQHFNQKDPVQQAWYYRTVARCLRELSDTDAYREYVYLTNKVFANIKEES